MLKIGDVWLNGECYDRFALFAEAGATTVHSVAGVTFRKEAIETIATCTEHIVTFVPEPDNEYDKNACKVMINDVHVGYVKRDRAPPTKCYGVVRLTVDPVAIWIAVE